MPFCAVLKKSQRSAEAIRPDIAGIMGAFGAALIARERYQDCEGTTMLPIEEIEALEYKTTMTKCRGCTNNCRLTINHFSGGRKFITGNRCERGLGKEKSKNHLPNLFEYKRQRYFGYTSLSEEEASRGTIGLPRVLNMYENYPFWHTFFTTLGFRVVLLRLLPERFTSWESNPFRVNPNVIRQSWHTDMYSGLSTKGSNIFFILVSLTNEMNLKKPTTTTTVRS